MSVAAVRSAVCKRSSQWVKWKKKWQTGKVAETQSTKGRVKFIRLADAAGSNDYAVWADRQTFVLFVIDRMTDYLTTV